MEVSSATKGSRLIVQNLQNWTQYMTLRLVDHTAKQVEAHELAGSYVESGWQRSGGEACINAPIAV